MFKILGLLCLSTAFSLSFMYLQGVKLSDMQVGSAAGAGGDSGQASVQCGVVPAGGASCQTFRWVQQQQQRMRSDSKPFSTDFYDGRAHSFVVLLHQPVRPSRLPWAPPLTSRPPMYPLPINFRPL